MKKSNKMIFFMAVKIYSENLLLKDTVFCQKNVGFYCLLFFSRCFSALEKYSSEEIPSPKITYLCFLCYREIRMRVM